MTPSFPYLTVALLEKDGQSILSNALVLFPNSTHDINFALDCLKYLNKLPIVTTLLQDFCDRINAATGAVATG